MTKLLPLIIILSLIISCKTEYKRCRIEKNDNFLKAYNDILNEIIAKRIYNLYLGKDEERIFKKYASNIADSNKINKEIIDLHNTLFKDSARFCTIYLDTSLHPTFNKWSYFQTDTNSFSLRIKNIISNFSDKGQAVIDSLNSLQTKYSAKDFMLCIANIKSVTERKTGKIKCYIGKVVFSKLTLNSSKNKGLLYYEFRCGELCGYGSLVCIVNNNNNWEIDDSVMIWRS